jgi:N-acetyl-anhydromuramyl-L-alanine amidase AmpD
MPDPAPLSYESPNVLDLQFIVVSVQTDFLGKKGDGTGMLFHWVGSEFIVHANVELLALNSAVALDSARTDAQGQAELETSQLPDGFYTVRITPDNSRNALAGPGIAEDPAEAPLPERMYHPLEVTVRLSRGSIAEATIKPEVKYAALGNRRQTVWPPHVLPTDLLPIDLKPIWMRAPRAAGAAPRTDDIKMVVVHNTGADPVPVALIGYDIETFLSAPKPPDYHEIHYLMDLNGHVIKFMKDSTVSFHAGPGNWKDQAPNDISIGIEIVHKEAGVHEYTPDQYASLLDLIGRLFAAYHFDRTQIVGHSDVGTQYKPTVVPYVLDGWRDQDPGQVFRWEKLEKEGWGMIPLDTPLGDAYGNLFNLAEVVILRENDNDARHHFGGKNRPATPGTPIADLQDDLAQIGYSIPPAGREVQNVDNPSKTHPYVRGTYDNYTTWAVKAFQRHFFSGSRRRGANGTVDQATAQMIKNVLAGISAPAPVP